MDILFLSAFPDNETPDELPVVVVGSTGEVFRLCLGESIKKLSGQKVSLVLPAKYFSFFVVELPSVKTHWLRQAVAYAVEELIAESVDDMHFAISKALHKGFYSVVAVRKQALDVCLKFFEARAIDIASIYVDSDLLPKDENYVFFHEQILFSGRDGARGSFERDEWSFFKGYFSSYRLLSHQQESLPTVPPGDASLASAAIGDASYVFLAAHLSFATNIAQGEFSLRGFGDSLGLWRAVVFTGVFFLCLAATFNYLSARYLEGLATKYDGESMIAYRKAFPEDRRIVSLRAQLDQHLGELKKEGRASAVMVMAEISSAIGEIPSLEIVNFAWSMEKEEATLMVRSADFSDLERLRNELVGKGYITKMSSASKDEGRAIAQFMINGFGK